MNESTCTQAEANGFPDTPPPGWSQRLRFPLGIIAVGVIAACSWGPDAALYGDDDDGGSDAQSVGAKDGACVVSSGTLATAGFWCGTNLLTAPSNAIYQCDGVNENALASMPCSECKTGPNPGQDRCLSAVGSDGSAAGDANAGSGGTLASDSGAADAPEAAASDGDAGSAGQAGSGGSSGCSGLYDGWYCGGDKVNGDLNTLYRCKNGQTVHALACPYASSCKIMPEGTNDYCPCAKVGWYCGGNEIKGDSDTLYYCNGERVDTSLTKDCAGLNQDCIVKPAGTPDSCG